MQCNALRIILGKRDFEPAEVARLDYRLLVRSPRIGQKGIHYIRNWLQRFGLEIANYPPPSAQRVSHRQEQQVIKAVNVLRRNGFEVHLESLHGRSKKWQRGDEH